MKSAQNVYKIKDEFICSELYLIINNYKIKQILFLLNYFTINDKNYNFNLTIPLSSPLTITNY